MDSNRPAPRPPNPRHRWLLSWPALVVLFGAPGLLWALASPRFSVPDEPAHAIKAVALWNGQLSGDERVDESQYRVTTFQIPAVWAQARSQACFAFEPSTTADCAPPFAGSEAISGVDSTAGSYPPLYYAIVGWGGRLSAGPLGLHLMRVTSALACAVLLAAAVRSLAHIIDPRLAIGGVLVAATPMVFFLAGSVNPNGLEIAAAIAVWCTLVALLHLGDRHERPLPRPLVVQLAVTASVMALARPLSPAFLALIVVLAAISVPFRAVRRILGDRSVLVSGGVAVSVSALATLWVVMNGTLSSAAGRIGVGSENPLLVIVGETDVYVSEMIGVFGWLDTQPPTFVILAWLAAVFGLLALGGALGTRRSSLGLLSVLVATFVVPIVAQYPAATSQGLPWQGRYTLPIAVGLPILAVIVVDSRRALLGELPSRVAAGLAVVTGVATVAAFFWALRRYTTGDAGSLRIWSGAWQPPGGSVLLVLAMTAYAAATVAVIVALGRGERRPVPADLSELRSMGPS